MAAFRTLDDLAVKGKRVLVRVDLNVPMADGAVADASRIDRLRPTVAELADKGARVVLLSHLGRPEGRRRADLSLRPVAAALSQRLGRPVAFAEDCVGPAAAQAVEALEDGGILLLENLRFHAQEEANDPEFVRALASLGELYVNDAFSAAHRAHASTTGLAHVLPAAAGRLMAAELAALDATLGAPRRPAAAIVGGAKVSTKLDLLGNLVARFDELIIAGAMANTFLLAQGIEVGRSLCEAGLGATARAIMAAADEGSCEIVLPKDAVVAPRLEPGAASRTVAIDAVPADQMILDVGPETVADLEGRLAGSRTLMWNGPLGAFETPPFDAATLAVARRVAELTAAGGLISVAGGGDTVAALNRAGVAATFSYVSTAGGAFLAWLEGKALPGVSALDPARPSDDQDRG